MDKLDLELEDSIKNMIRSRLDLEAAEVEAVGVDDPLFIAADEEGTGLGLDSVDALEIVVGLKEQFGVKVSDKDMEIFRSIRTIADHIRKKRAEELV
ncbi:acyl carrier protein [Paenibacillus donghaensis]|uniref:Carrier domain-containing protein n=1 Tax=Paenibacillus donghaensis TaxID=414771 RepID=A0A2Z2KB47_9BACL|nr:phosphopantetheine-binding protein [Paenibacillus donghaensis]ASA20190.1 hypothetical protein B9T62_04875 [Paenibacillus donghaensis]